MVKIMTLVAGFKTMVMEAEVVVDGVQWWQCQKTVAVGRVSGSGGKEMCWVVEAM
jgi:hypothetical protein